MTRSGNALLGVGSGARLAAGAWWWPLLAHVSIVSASVSADFFTIAITVFVSAVGALIVATMLADRVGVIPHGVVPFGQWTATLAGGLSLGAAAIHFAVIGDHFAEYPPFGVAFAVLASFQVAWAVAWLVERRRWIGMAAVMVNAGALAVWATSRVVGLPIGPQLAELEAVGPLDLAAAAMEIGLIGLLAWDLGVHAIRMRPPLPTAGATVVIGSGAIAIVMLTSMAFVVVAGDPHGAAAEVGLPASAGSQAPADHEPATRSPSASAGPSGPAATFAAGEIRFGTTLDLAGQIAMPADQFGPGEAAVWIANFREAPEVPMIRLQIIEALPDGRLLEHWQQDIPLDDPGARRLVAGADLSIYLHGGAGSYRMRYLRGVELLAEGAFEFVP
jgi:hypothetical protein